MWGCFEEDFFTNYHTNSLFIVLALTKRTLPIDDSIIAATAIYYNMTLVTRNIKDYNDIPGINLINP